MMTNAEYVIKHVARSDTREAWEEHNPEVGARCIVHVHGERVYFTTERAHFLDGEKIWDYVEVVSQKGDDHENDTTL